MNICVIFTEPLCLRCEITIIPLEWVLGHDMNTLMWGRSYKWPFKCLRTYNLIPTNYKAISIVFFMFVTMNALSLNNFSPLAPQSFFEESKKVVDFIADYYRNVEKYLIQSQVNSGYLMYHCLDSAPYSPKPLESILKGSIR